MATTVTTAGQVISAVQTAVQKSPTGVSFISLKRYENAKGEIANHLINVGFSYEKAKEKDIKILQECDVTTLGGDIEKPLLEAARVELLNSLLTPDKARSEGQINAYTHIEGVKGVKVHIETGALYIYALRVKKEVLVKGEYPEVKSKPITLAKNYLKKELELHTAKFVNYKVANIDAMKVNGDTLEIG